MIKSLTYFVFFSIGEIPSYVRGSILRVGPGKYDWGKTRYNHWFEGESLLHKFEIKDGGRAQYSSSFLRTRSYVESEKRGCIALDNFATIAAPDPCKNIFERFFSYFFPPEESTDNCNVHVVTIKGQPVACADIPRMWQIDPDNMKVVESLKVEARLNGKSNFSFCFYCHLGPVYT